VAAARAILSTGPPAAQIAAWEFLRSQGAALDVSENLASAEALYRSGRAAEAAGLSELVASSGERRSAAWVLAGLCRHKAREHRRARTAFERVLEDSGASAGDRGAALLGIARSFRSEGDTTRMEVAYRRASEEAAAPAHRAEALWELAREFDEAGRREETLPLYRRILQETPEGDYAADARFAVGLVHFRAGRTREALHAFANARDRAASVADRNRARVWMARGLSLRGDSDSAMVVLGEAASSGGEDLYGLAAERILSEGIVPSGGLIEHVFSPARRHAGVPAADDQGGASDSTRRAAPVVAPAAGDAVAGWLMDLGFAEEALVPLRRIAAAGDAGMRLATAAAALAGGQPSFALREADALRGVAPESARSLVQRLRFPVVSAAVVAAQAEALHLDPLFVYAVMRQESLFDPMAVSTAGARGLLQLMPATAQAEAWDLGEAGPGDEALLVAETNIRLGARHLMRLAREFGGEIPTIAAAYNAGSEKARYWRSRAGDPDALIETIGYRETRTYVKLVLRNLLLYERLYRP
jgi:soluble lytic murein transglycosylase